jgi:hypothetical protein
MYRHVPDDQERILDRISVASPCQADWQQMKGDERVRHCTLCQQKVYNLSGMSRREAATLITQREGRLCVRLYLRPDGTLVTSDCRELLQHALKRGCYQAI